MSRIACKIGKSGASGRNIRKLQIPNRRLYYFDKVMQRSLELISQDMELHLSDGISGCNGAQSNSVITDSCDLLLAEDSMFEDVLDDIVEDLMGKYGNAEKEENPKSTKKDGTSRQVNRVDYTRGPKRVKSNDPWRDCLWLRLKPLVLG